MHYKPKRWAAVETIIIASRMPVMVKYIWEKSKKILEHIIKVFINVHGALQKFKRLCVKLNRKNKYLGGKLIRPWVKLLKIVPNLLAATSNSLCKDKNRSRHLYASN